MLTIHHGDNLDYLRGAAERGERFDLVELDGPYGAGLEGWDCLSEAEYVRHYAERLTLVRQVLQPWGVVFLFGYPEMVAEVKAWAHATGTLRLRRWVNWYKRVTAHKGRKVEAIGVFVQPRIASLAGDLSRAIAEARKQRGWTIAESVRQTGINIEHVKKAGGWLWFENGQTLPTRLEYQRLKEVFDLPDDLDVACDVASYEGLTDLDYIGKTYSERTEGLNAEGLRSKPIGLYTDLFTPVVPPRETKRALVLYGGSGNAAVAAARLGYEVTVCEAEAARCDLIRRNYAQRIEHSLAGLPLFDAA